MLSTTGLLRGHKRPLAIADRGLHISSSVGYGERMLMKRKTLKNKLDSVFSQLIRARGRCEKCGNTTTLQTSHIYSRRNLAVRWDELNANCFCAKCHFWWHENPLDGIKWLKTHYTSKQIKELEQRANNIKKWSDKELEMLLEHLTKRLDD